MTRATDLAKASTRGAAAKFRHLPDRTPLDDTVASIPGDLPLEGDDERNVFIAAALNAGG